VGSDWDEPLGYLRWHYGEAYVVCLLAPDVWTAERRDTHETLRANEPEKLLQLIRDDYAARPVSRAVSPSGTRQGKYRPGLSPNR
jgi:hypothetical protein